jgi:hypothetical protein
MRTTVEIADRQRAKLLEIAASRGESGFSHLVQEAIDLYLARLAERRADVDGAIAALGTLSDEETEVMEASVRRARSRWR